MELYFLGILLVLLGNSVCLFFLWKDKKQQNQTKDETEYLNAECERLTQAFKWQTEIIEKTITEYTEKLKNSAEIERRLREENEVLRLKLDRYGRGER